MTAADRPIRVVTYNVHGCVGLDGKRSEMRIAEVLAALQLDIIGLQELDTGRQRSRGVDQSAIIAEQLGFQRYFHPAMRWQNDEHYGDAILSRWPMKLCRADSLPSEKAFLFREIRGAIWVQIESPQGVLNVMNTHLGLGRQERIEQVEALTGEGWLGAVPGGQPVLLLGDFNSLSGAAARKILLRSLRDAGEGHKMATFPTFWPLLGLDSIFVNAAVLVERMRVARTKQARIASDHYPLLGEIRV